MARITKGFGRFRVTASRGGIGASVRVAPGLRLGVGADGRLYRTVSGTAAGVTYSDTRRVGPTRPAPPWQAPGAPANGPDVAAADQTGEPVAIPTDGPPATRSQRAYVGARVTLATPPGAGWRVPRDLTIAGAVAILAMIGEGPAPLFKMGRAWGSAGRATRAWYESRQAAAHDQSSTRPGP